MTAKVHAVCHFTTAPTFKYLLSFSLHCESPILQYRWSQLHIKRNHSDLIYTIYKYIFFLLKFYIPFSVVLTELLIIWSSFPKPWWPREPSWSNIPPQTETFSLEKTAVTHTYLKSGTIRIIYIWTHAVHRLYLWENKSNTEECKIEGCRGKAVVIFSEPWILLWLGLESHLLFHNSYLTRSCD